jgi:ribosomal protein L23
VKKVAFVFACLLIVAVALLYFSSDGPSLPGPLAAATGDSKILRQRSIDFLEDLQFKDFDKAASYHSTEDRKKVNISKMIERLFAVKPEFLDIMRYEVKSVDIDRSGDRAKVKTKTVIKVLNTSKIEEPEVLLYWRKDPKEGWVMMLESSLH